MENTWMIILPEIVLAAGGLLIFLSGAFYQRRPESLPFYLGLVFLAGAIVAYATLPLSGEYMEGMLGAGGYTRLFGTLIASIGFVCVLFSSRYARARAFDQDTYYAILLFAVLGMGLTARATHWLVLFLGLELLSISLYILIAIRRNDPFQGEAGLKYLMTGAVASAFLVFGIALWYAGSGSLFLTTYLTSTDQSTDIPLLLTALALIMAGIGFKLSMAPFHLWTADVYEGSPAPVTAFLATGSKVAVFAFLIRFCLHLQKPLWDAFQPILWIAAFLTLIVGTLTALSQTQLKRLLAYSSVAQMGYLFMTLLAVKMPAGIFALAFYLIVYAVMDLGAFGTIASLSHAKNDLDALEDYQGLGYTRPWHSAVLCFCLLSLAGFPPTAGFVGKLVLFKAVLQAKEVSLALTAITMAVLSLYLYMKVVVILFMKPASKTAPKTSIGLYEKIGSGLIFLFLLEAGIAPSPLLSLIAHLLSGGS